MQLDLFSEWKKPIELPALEQNPVYLKKVSEVDLEIRAIIDQFKKEYLNTENWSAWVFPSSFGKDSTLMCLCLIIALSEIEKSLLLRPVHIVSSDTGLENPLLKQFVQKSIDGINDYALNHNIPCLKASIVNPSINNRFAIKCIAKGLPMTTPRSIYRWCTDAFKINPIERVEKLLIKQLGSVVVFTGVRIDESQNRASKLEKYKDNPFIFAKNNTLKSKQQTRYESHPIKNVSIDLLWRTLMKIRVFPWGTRFTELYALYKDSEECPSTKSDKGKSCGSSRSGCIICLYVAKDHMLEHFSKQGQEWADPIIELRTLMRDMIYDIRFREPIRKTRIKEIKNGKDVSINQMNLFENTKLDNSLDVDSIGLDSSPVTADLALASFTLEARIFLLKNVLYYQAQAGIEIVSPEDIEEIKKIWTSEMSWKENILDITPEKLDYKGSLVMDKDYNLNEKESSIPNLMIDPKFYALDQKNEPINHHCIMDFSILNRKDNCNWSDLNYLFFVPIDFTGNEEEIYDCIEKNRIKKQMNIPYYWQPVYTKQNEFWNSVTFIVCQKGITTHNQALHFVEQFLHDDYLDEKNNFIQSSSYKIALQSYQTPSFVVTQDNVEKRIVQHLRDYELGMMMSIGLRELVNHNVWSEYLWNQIKDLADPEEVRLWLLDKELPAEIIPESIKFFADIDDYMLNLNYLKSLYSKEEMLKALNLLEKVR